LILDVGVVVGPDVLDNLVSESQDGFLVCYLVFVDMYRGYVESVILVGLDLFPRDGLVVLLDLD